MNDSNSTTPDNVRYQQGVLVSKALATSSTGLLAGDFNIPLDQAATGLPPGSAEADIICHEVESEEARIRRLAASYRERYDGPLGHCSGAQHEYCGDNYAMLRAFAEEHGIPLPASDLPQTNP